MAFPSWRHSLRTSGSGSGSPPSPDIAVCPRGSSVGELKTVSGATPRLAYLYLGVMIATWAANWPLMRLALAHAEPMVFVSLRMAGSIAILAPILALLRRPLLPVPRERHALFWVGLFQVAGFVVFSIIGWPSSPPVARSCSLTPCRSGRSPSVWFCRKRRSHRASSRAPP